MSGIQTLVTSPYHALGNGGTERVNDTTAHILSMVVSERPYDRDKQLSHVESAYNNSVSTATCFVPDEVHLGRLDCLPLL